MALSKAVSDAPSKAMRLAHGDSWIVIGYMWDAGERVAVRFAAPWRELGTDMTEGIAYYVNTIIQSALAIASTPTALAVVQTLQQQRLAHCRKAVAGCVDALTELSEDSGGLWLPVLVAALCPVIGAGPLTMAGISAPLKLTYLGCAGMSALGIHRFYGEKAGLSSQSQNAFHRAMVVMLLAGSLQVFLAHGGLPMLADHINGAGEVVHRIVSPEALCFAVSNIMLYPLILANMGYVAGAEPAQMVPCVALNVMGGSAMILSTTSTLPGIGPLVCAGASVVFYFGCTMAMGPLADSANQLSFANENRVKQTCNVMMLSWTMAPLVQALALVHSLDIEQARAIFAILDLSGKLLVLHILLKSRPAMEAAGHHYDEPY